MAAIGKGVRVPPAVIVLREARHLSQGKVSQKRRVKRRKEKLLKSRSTGKRPLSHLTFLSCRIYEESLAAVGCIVPSVLILGFSRDKEEENGVLAVTCLHRAKAMALKPLKIDALGVSFAVQGA